MDEEALSSQLLAFSLMKNKTTESKDNKGENKNLNHDLHKFRNYKGL